MKTSSQPQESLHAPLSILTKVMVWFRHRDHSVKRPLRVSPSIGKPTLLNRLPLPSAEAQKTLAKEGTDLSPFLEERLRHFQEVLGGSVGVDTLAATSADLVSWLCHDPDIQVAIAPPANELPENERRSKSLIYDDFFQCVRVLKDTAESAAIALSTALGAVIHESVAMEKDTPTTDPTQRSLLVNGFETLIDVILDSKPKKQIT
jgi:hypothetical protein